MLSYMAQKKIMEILREKDVVKASLIFDIPVDILKKMNEQGLLNAERIKAMVIKQDFLNYKRIIKQKYEGKYEEGEILAALRKEYDVSLKEIRDIVYGNVNNLGIFCRCCGRRIGNLQAKRSGGLCISCNADSLPKL